MKKRWSRLLTAAGVSSSVFFATLYWYATSGNSRSTRKTEQPLAYVGNLFDQIQRRQSNRLLWQILNKGEPLYDGEAIRTSERGEVRINFMDSDRYLEVAPESLIIIKKSETEINLDLLEGSVFVQADTRSTHESTSRLVLNSAEGKIDLSKSSATLTRGQGASIDIRVHQGKALLKEKTGAQKNFLPHAELKILSPDPHSTVALNTEAPEPILFEWKSSTKNTTVSLLMGETRKDLASVAITNPDETKILTQVPFGRRYWKLKATSPDGQTVAESATFKIEVIPKQNTQPVAPYKKIEKIPEPVSVAPPSPPQPPVVTTPVEPKPIEIVKIKKLEIPVKPNLRAPALKRIQVSD